MAGLGDFFSWYHDNGIIPNLWKGFTGQLSAEKQNEQNIDFQRDVLDYQKQLQQKIFEREDTAFERASADAQKIGINPMALAGSSGAGAGAVVPTQAPQSNIDYSSFGGLAGLQSISSALGVASQVSSAVNEFKTGNIQRDLLRSEQMRQKMENAIFAYKNGLNVNPDGSVSVTKDSPLREREIQTSQKANTDANTENTKANTKGQNTTNKRNERVLDYQEKTGTTDQTPTPLHLGASAAYMADKLNKNLFESEQDSLTRAYTDELSDLSLSNMWARTENYLNNGSFYLPGEYKQEKKKRFNFFKRYLNYRFGTNFKE